VRFQQLGLTLGPNITLFHIPLTLLRTNELAQQRKKKGNGKPVGGRGLALFSIVKI